jgi:hypothetical protein
MHSQQSSTSSINSSCLAYLPAANTEKEAQHIGLLLLLELFDVFQGTHLVFFYDQRPRSFQQISLFVPPTLTELSCVVSFAD